METAAEWVDVGTLKPWGRNPKRLDEADVERMVRSIERFGWADVIVARKADGEIVSGHLRHAAALRMGLAQVPVRWVSLDPAEAHALAVAVTRHEQLRPFADDLGDVLREIDAEGADLSGLGWTDAELSAILEVEAVPEAEAEEPDEPAEDGPVYSVPGEVYELGPHRLVCGDSTHAATWESLMGTERAQMVWTDPPYGVAYVGKTKDAMTIQNDALSEGGLQELLTDALGMALAHCEPGAAWYVAAPSGPLFAVFGSVLSQIDVWRSTIVWVKDQFVLGRSDYHYRHESIFYGWAPGGAHFFVDDRTQDSVHEVPRPSANKDHPTMKPVALIRRHIENSSKRGWVVLEPFGGSGSTLMACAETGRVARLAELDPKYCDVIRRRWTRWARANKVDPGPGALDG